MNISSYDLSRFAHDLNNQLQELRKKFKFFSDEEVKKRGGSNFTLGISENLDVFLSKVERVLSENKELSLNNDLVRELKIKYDEFPKKFKEIDDLCNSIFNSDDGSVNKPTFALSFCDWFKETFQIIWDLYEQFVDKIELQKIISQKDIYDEIIKKAEAKDSEMQKVLDSIKEKSDALLLKLEQNIAEHEILDIKEYYTKNIEIIRKEKNLYGWGFLIFSLILLGCLFCLFTFMNKFFPKEEMHLVIPRSILSCSFLGLFTFLINDFRKRFNICKNILDELNQKVIVVNTYTSLLARIKDFDDETKKKYHDKIIQNIIDTLLLIRNHGYLSKILNQSDPNLASKIIEELGSLLPKNPA